MHDHLPIYSETFNLGQEIPFHAKLKDWLKQYWDLKDSEILHIQEIGCDDHSCPVFETIIVATEIPNLPQGKNLFHSLSDSEILDNFRILKLGKAKHLLTKQDIYFSVEKQK